VTNLSQNQDALLIRASAIVDGIRENPIRAALDYLRLVDHVVRLEDAIRMSAARCQNDSGCCFDELLEMVGEP
jgi:hypothetical protein